MTLREHIRQRDRQRRIVTLVVMISCLVVLTAFSCGNAAPKGQLVTETYTVVAGDTLWDIAGKYMQKNTYAPREIREFYQGIIELNYDSVFSDRQLGDIRAGDRLQINYWIKN
ncbi:MAG: LysM peptidoglycan-binding domain-containing protein [Veillonellales bacterium]